MTLGEAVEFLDHLRKPVTASDRNPGPYPYYGANGQQDSVDDYIFDEPLILLAEDGGNFGNPDRTIAYQIEGKSWVNNHAHVLRPKENVDIRFLCRHLERYDVRQFVSGTTRLKLNKAKAAAIPIALPKLEEQKRIAAILDKADAIRRKRQEAIADVNSLIDSVFYDTFGDPLNSSQQWPVLKVGDVADIIVPTRDKPKSFSGTIPWVTLPDIQGLYVGSSQLSLTAQEAEQVGTRLIPENAVLLSCAGSLSVVAITTRELYTNQQFYGLVPKRGVVDPVYLAYSLRLRKEAFYKRLAGTVTISFFSKARALAIGVPKPPMDIQTQFVERIAAIHSVREKMVVQEREADDLFNSLVQRAFKGDL